jgi:hypothetical protein
LGVASCCVRYQDFIIIIIIGRQSQQSFLFSHSTHSLHVSAREGHLQVNIIVSEKKIKKFVAIDGHYNKVLCQA